jgi:hypothetical protein
VLAARGAARAMVLGVRSSCTGWPDQRCGPSARTTSLTMPGAAPRLSNTSRMSLISRRRRRLVELLDPVARSVRRGAVDLGVERVAVARARGLSW